MSWAAVFFSGKGRISRADFWIAWFLLAITNAVLSLLGPAGLLLSFLLLYPQLCLYAKRLHDGGRSGWLMLAPLAATLVTTLAGNVLAGWELQPGKTGLTIGGAFVIVLLSIFAVVFFLRTAIARGQISDNAYGPPPPRVFGKRVAQPA
jgi:uncharacterized membrane protein YhaH (DUF805 family)